jgi:hypothetical protein
MQRKINEKRQELLLREESLWCLVSIVALVITPLLMAGFPFKTLELTGCAGGAERLTMHWCLCNEAPRMSSYTTQCSASSLHSICLIYTQFLPRLFPLCVTHHRWANPNCFSFFSDTLGGPVPNLDLYLVLDSLTHHACDWHWVCLLYTGVLLMTLFFCNTNATPAPFSNNDNTGSSDWRRMADAMVLLPKNCVPLSQWAA